ncbi:cytochrome P450 89A2-like [Pistacia vera]|uniref:cytochrome P450 89A2-like n=1 Tax=Pistacia vera TaxID=55513 RepID=UPI001262E91C|nr:cytochrome P450 89A2-like [Pistacia vera]
MDLQTSSFSVVSSPQKPQIPESSHQDLPLFTSLPTSYGIEDLSLSLEKSSLIFAKDRPKTIFADRIFPNKREGVSLLPYGATWCSLRRNLTGTSGVLHPSRLISCSHIRKRVLDNLIHRFKQDSEHGGGVHVVDHFTYTIFSLVVLMCFGNNLDENTIRELECSQNKFFTCFPKVKVFLIMPNLGKILFRNRWNEFVNMLKDREDMFLSLIRARKKMKLGENKGENIDQFVSYVGTLLELQVPNENKKFEEGDIVSLSDEFISAGTDTTTALQWIMANVVKYPRIHEKNLAEMRGVVEQGRKWIKEDDLQKLPYLKAVVLEGLRRHPPTYQAATPHVVTEDTELGGYLIPKGTTVNFLIADRGRDPNMWKDPVEFKPERFLFSHGDKSFDIRGREIKMMPFGAGRRICPGLGFAILHLEYFVANLIWHFEWSAVDGEDIDLSEKIDITIKMKNPLRVHLSSR